MPDQQDPSTIDITAVITQIQTLKQQRDNAMDDVAILMGQLESLKKSFKELQDAQAKDKTDAGTPKPDTETA